ncbi:MAG: acyl--CoA ligase [Niastella sp.]|nr:acyl--CoA ligase [Niastella sp.]
MGKVGLKKIYPNPYFGKSLDDYINILKKTTSWKLEMATSGTTGLPKKVVHSFSSLTRSIKINEHRKADVWGLAYNPTHMAGMQVFFQSFLNKNTIINLFGLNRSQIFSSLDEYGISHISATPTFYKLLLPATEVFKNVKQITFGGEKFSEVVQNSMRQLFPLAKFTNVYASTEAGALFAATGDHFTISDKINPFVKIVENELWIHEKLIANSSDLQLQDGWYLTGDMVQIIITEPITFQFVSRKNEMINIGGSKVNPNEVEEHILENEAVTDAKVFGKPNSLMGTILCADIVLNKVTTTEKDIKVFLKERLPEYMVPRIVKFVPAIAMTDTGKKSRV